MTEPELRWSTDDEPPPADALVVDGGLGEANLAAAPSLHQARPLACFVRDSAGTVIGGAVGRTWGACCELQQLWVAPARRRRGLGAGLLRRFEARAAQRGCRVFYLDTFSFQAPSLYESLGYRTVLRIAGYDAGIVKHTMLKRLEPASDADDAGADSGAPAQNSSRLSP